jgi:sugar phosphate permease
LELGIQTTISNWFIRRRPLGLAADTVAKGAGLTMVPLLAQFIITGSDWRTAWFTLGILAFALGVVPPVLFMARRPEDMGLEPDPIPQDQLGAEPTTSGSASGPKTAAIESNFTVGQAFRTRAFWLLAAFSMAGYTVHAGISLHQVAHYIDQGLTGPSAALTASAFAFSQILSGMFLAVVGRRVPVRFLLSAAAFVMAVAAFGSSMSSSLPPALISAATIGVGAGGLHLLVRLAWADYYGREHLGTIRGFTMSAQIGGQAAGPVVAGFLFDATGSYQLPIMVFTGLAALAGLLALFATPPRLRVPQAQPASG